MEGARRHPDGEPYEILIVIDDAASLESLDLALGPDYRILTTASASDGLEILESAKIALILAHEFLPSMAGVEFLERAREIFIAGSRNHGFPTHCSWR